MNIDFPSNPQLNDTFQGENGINYQWDGEKWVLYVDSDAAQASLWARDAASTTVYPANVGDDIAVRAANGAIIIRMGSDGDIAFTSLDIDSLPTLP